MSSYQLRNVAAGAALLCATAALFNPVAAAAKSAPAAPTIALASGASSVKVGTWMTFATTYPSTVKGPMIQVNCYESGVTVWGQVGGTAASFKLGGDASPWLQVGGNANCAADLVNITWSHGVESVVVLAATQFLGTP